MSLVNDMLKDLEERRAPGVQPDASTVAGLHPAPAPARRAGVLPYRLTLALGAGVLGGALWWWAQTVATSATPVADTAPLAVRAPDPPAGATAAMVGARDPGETETGRTASARSGFAAPPPAAAASNGKDGAPAKRLAAAPRPEGTTGQAALDAAVSAAAGGPAGKAASSEGPPEAGTIAEASEIGTSLEGAGDPEAPPAQQRAAAPPRRSASSGEPLRSDPTTKATAAEPVTEESSAREPPPAREPGAGPSRTPGTEGPAGRAQSSAGAAEAADGAEDRGTVRKSARPLSPEQRAARAYGAGTKLLRQGEAAAAEDRLRAALAHSPPHAGAREALAVLLLRRGRTAEAVGLLRDGLRIAADEPGLARLYARVLVERGRAAQAARVLERAADARFEARDHGLLAAVYQRLGRHTEAVGAYRRALRGHPERGVWWMGLGISLEAEGETTRALAAYRRAAAGGRLEAEVARYVARRIEALAGAGG